MEKRTTLSDVAQQAGVHRTTVSLALRNHPSIPAPTRQRLQALAEQMCYKPDPNLRALMVYRSAVRERKNPSTLGYVTNWKTRWGWKQAPAHAQFYEGANAKAEELGFTLEHFWLGEPGLSHRRLSDILFARGIRGVVLASHSDWIDEPVSFDWSHFSAVKIDFLPHWPRLNNITNDQRSILQMAMHHVREAGYQRIGFVLPQWWDDFVDLAWSAGFLATQARLPATDHVPLLCYPNTFTSPDIRQMAVPRDALKAWLERHRPEVILGYAPYVLPQLEALGWRVPDDVAFADIFLETETGDLAGMRQNCQRVGEVAVETLASQLGQNIVGIPDTPTTTLVEGTWCSGGSLPSRHEAVLLAAS